MNTNVTKLLLAAAALVVAGTAAAQLAEQPVRIKTDGLPTHLRDRLEAKAQEGPTALIQYVNRTRMMGYQVRVEEIVVPEDSARVAAAQKAMVATKADDEPKK